MTGAIYVAVKTALRVLTLVYTFVSSNCYILTKLFFLLEWQRNQTDCRVAVILRRTCQLTLTRITHQVSRAFDLIQFAFNMAKVT